MISNKSKQIYITTFLFPINSVNSIFFKNEIFDLLCTKKDFYIKKFIGTDWSVIGSGFIFYGPNNLKSVFTISDIINNDFNIINKYLITYLNDIQNNNNIKVVLSLINNTINYSTIVEFSIEYEKDSDLLYLNEIINISLIKEKISQFCYELNSLIKAQNDNLIINHSLIIKKNYKDSFNFFYNWNNIAKSLKTDKVWKIISENEEKDNKEYKNFSIIINENIKIHYRVILIEEKEGEKIEIIYNKTGNSFPALNEYIKMSFINIDRDLCYFLYETHFPMNISSSLFQTTFNYIDYCNKKSKKYLENEFNK